MTTKDLSSLQKMEREVLRKMLDDLIETYGENKILLEMTQLQIKLLNE